jgi:hypothetical protein
MPDGKHDFVGFREERSVSLGDRQNINELLARLDALEKELGAFHPRNRPGSEFHRSRGRGQRRLRDCAGYAVAIFGRMLISTWLGARAGCDELLTVERCYDGRPRFGE